MRKLQLFFLFFFLPFSICNSMQIKRVIFGCNNNPTYIQFWPIVAPICTQMGFIPTLAFIGDKNYPIDESIGDVIRFPSLPNAPESLQAQAIRLLLPALYPNDVCLISDIDMLLISKSYFNDCAATCPENTFLVYRDGAYSLHDYRYPMCYVAAKGSIFASVFNVYSYEEILSTLQYWQSLGYGWSTDEYMLYAYVNQWEKEGGKVLRLGHDVTGRIDRANWWIDIDQIDFSTYIDCHCPRPYLDYKESIDPIVEAIHKQIHP